MNGYPTNSIEALNALNNGFASSSSSSNGADHFPPPNSASFPMRQSSQSSQPSQPPPMHPMSAQQNWMQQNNYPHPPAVQHSQYPAPWSSQMPPQGFHNGMPLPFIPQQVIHDAFALSHPVEPADEPVLVKALVESRPRGETYKEALNRLHGIAGHSASLWKDYYLDHRERLDLAVQTHAAPRKTVKKPSIGTFKSESSPFSSSAMSASSPGPSKSRRPSQQPAQLSRAPSRSEPSPLESSVSAGGTRRRTINSMTSHTLVYNERIPPPNTELKIPDPPSRSPSPPTEVIPHNRGGHKFTPADRAYFIKFIQWRLKSDPTLMRGELCELLAEKAPHHTAQSWASYWQSHHDLPDKILASVREGEEQDEAEDSEEEKPKPKKKKVVVQRKPKYKELSSSESDLTESDSEEQEEVQTKEEDDANDDDIEIPPFDESAMGPKGGPFTKGDLGVVARHVASWTAAEFSELSMQDKWGEIARRYPQRALKSWGEYYRRNSKTIDKMAKKLRKLKEAEAETEREAQPAPPQPPAPLPTPQPTWTASQNNGTHGPPRAKRKWEDMVEPKRPKPEGMV